ncbi:DUF86 domain-containing protein [Candidatus Skiveiella danica]|uniref:HepT-like ribonuclease domain-containing protein n=2 Tax=Candidatus Skiveiella danica TaxID=3386177 RepID=UPI0039B902B2
MTVDRTPAHLTDMLQFVRELRQLATGQTATEFASNRILCLAVEKLFINLGEAAFRVGEVRAGAMPDIPWRRIIGLRNLLAHGYEQVAHEVLFKTIAEDLPALESALVRWVDRLETT